MSFLDLAAERYSVRSYSDRMVEQEKIDKILKAAQLAPTAVNYQPQMIYVLKSEAAMNKINRLCRCIYGEAHLEKPDRARLQHRGNGLQYCLHTHDAGSLGTEPGFRLGQTV